MHALCNINGFLTQRYAIPELLSATDCSILDWDSTHPVTNPTMPAPAVLVITTYALRCSIKFSMKNKKPLSFLKGVFYSIAPLFSTALELTSLRHPELDSGSLEMLNQVQHDHHETVNL